MPSDQANNKKKSHGWILIYKGRALEL